MVLFILHKLTHSLNVHAQPSSGTRCLIFCQSLRLLPYFMCANSEFSGETAWMRRPSWAFAGRICDKYYNLMSFVRTWMPVKLNTCLFYEQSLKVITRAFMDILHVLTLAIFRSGTSWDFPFPVLPSLSKPSNSSSSVKCSNSSSSFWNCESRK